MRRPVQRRWQIGYTLMMVPPFIGWATLLFDLPRWLEVAAVLAIIALVFSGIRLLYRTRGGWQPSQTLPKPWPDDA